MKNVKNNIERINNFLLTLMVMISVSVPVYAFDGNTIKNNVINKFLGPLLLLFIVVRGFKEYAKNNTAGVVLAVVVGSFVYIFAINPDLINVFSDTIKGLLGV